MEIPDQLTTLLKERASKEPYWLAEAYNAAFERIYDYSKDDDNPYYHSSSDNLSLVLPDATLSDEFGDFYSIDETEQRGWELIVLADLARMAQNSHD
jgi:hypothetical protein